MSKELLHGRKEIAAYVKSLYGVGSVCYVSAMIRAGLRVGLRNTCTREEVSRFFGANPNFTVRTSYGVNACKRP